MTRIYLVAFVLAAVPAALIGGLIFALLPAVGWWLGVLIGLVAAAILVWYRAQRADRIVLGALGVDVRPQRSSERLSNMVEGLTLAGGVIPPILVVADDAARNGMAVRRSDRNHLVLTSGLVETLDVVQLEGAVAELVTTLRNGDAEAATIGAALLGRPLLDGPLRPLLAPVANAILGRLVSPDRDLEADRQAVSLTRYPPGLMKALQVIDGGPVRPAFAADGTAHLWLVDPTKADAPADERRAPVRLRIDALAEL